MTLWGPKMKPFEGDLGGSSGDSLRERERRREYGGVGCGGSLERERERERESMGWDLGVVWE